MPPMKRRYIRLVRRMYRYLRHPRIRKRPWLNALIKPIFDRDLWTPCRYSVASGLSIGLFCGMLPIPFQMVLAALASMRARVNIPVAMAACWISNPLTQVPIILFQERFGDWVREKTSLSMPKFLNAEVTFFDNTLNLSSYIVGFLLVGTILSILAYPLVYGLWMFIPKQGKTSTSAKKTERTSSQ